MMDTVFVLDVDIMSKSNPMAKSLGSPRYRPQKNKVKTKYSRSRAKRELLRQGVSPRTPVQNGDINSVITLGSQHT
jgi:hypothetical protein